MWVVMVSSRVPCSFQLLIRRELNEELLCADSGSDAASLSTTAHRVEGGWLLNGTKAWVTSAFEAKAVIVFAKNVSKSKNHNGITAFLIPIPSEGKFPEY